MSVHRKVETETVFHYESQHHSHSCLCVFCVGPLYGPPLWWWVLCGALPSVWVPCVDPLWVPCAGPLCGSPLVGPLCGSPVWVPRRLRHVASTRVMSPARSHAPALLVKFDHETAASLT